MDQQRAVQTLLNPFWPEIEEIDLKDLWFQLDEVTCHKNRETIELLALSLINVQSYDLVLLIGIRGADI